MTALSESRAPSDPDGRGPATPETSPQANPAEEAGQDRLEQAVRGQAVVRPPIKGQATVRSENSKPGPGPIYSSKHAIRSLIRSETETSAIAWSPREDESADEPADEFAVTTNPEPSSAPNAVVMAAEAQDQAAQDLSPVAAPTEVGGAQVVRAGGAPRVRSKLVILLPAAVALLMAFVVAVGYLAMHEPAPSAELGRWAGESAAVPLDPQASDDPLAAGVPDPFHTQKLSTGGAPTRLKIKSIGVDTSLETLRIGKAGELDPPKDFAKAGWYADGTSPGDVGPAVLAGHVDNKSGPAVFYKLRELAVGDKIQVVRGGKTVSFTVSSTAWYPKNAFPTAKVYGPTPDSQLRLITCGGVFDHRLRSYKDNLVVYAVLG